MAISLRLSEDEKNIVKTYAELQGITLSEFARQAMLEKIEDEYDFAAIREYEADRKNGVLETRPIEDFWAEMGL